MATYAVHQGFSGYVRGCYRLEVEGDSEEEALAMFNMHDCEMDIIRDDTHKDEIEVEEVIPYVEPVKPGRVVTEAMKSIGRLISKC